MTQRTNNKHNNKIVR